MPKMIQLRHVPDALHKQLKARAALSGLPLSDYLIREVRKIAEQPTNAIPIEAKRRRPTPCAPSVTAVDRHRRLGVARDPAPDTSR
jgi:plasmid stability protein